MWASRSGRKLFEDAMVVGSGLVGVVLEGIFCFCSKLLGVVGQCFEKGGREDRYSTTRYAGGKQTAFRNDGRWSKMILSIPSIEERLDNHIVNEEKTEMQLCTTKESRPFSEKTREAKILLYNKKEKTTSLINTKTIEAKPLFV